MSIMDPVLYLRQLEEELMSPAVRKDSKRLSELLADEFIEIGKTGKLYTKRSLIEILKNEDSPKTEIIDYKATLITDTLVLIMYTAIQYSEEKNKVYRTIRSSMWKYFNGNWKIIFHQGTPLTN